jgi:DAACS family dicarboxylate/amino acid:cation (Na+ or H+) symporter
MVLGLVVGPFLGPHAAPLGEAGKLVIQLIKAVATPLLFFAILNAILKTRVDGRSAVRMLLIATVNVTIALAIGLAASNVLRPGEHLAFVGTGGDQAAAEYAGKKVDFMKTLVSYVPANLVTPFTENLVLSVILIALLFGFGLRRVRRDLEHAGKASFRPVEDAISTLLGATEVVLGWIIKLVPVAVFAVAAKTVGEHGYAPLKGLAVYVGVGLLGLAVHILVTYQSWIVLVAGVPLARFWREAREPVVTALGTNSSLATLPVTLAALDRLGVSKASSTLGACVGTNLNNDGIVLYEGMAVLFVAQAAGIHLPVAEQLVVAITCIVAGMGVAGVPEAGFVSLALVLNTVGLPIEILPLLLAVDWVLARARSVTNVLSDMVLSILLDRFAGRSEGAVPAPS